MKKLVRKMHSGAVPMYFNLDFVFKLNKRDWDGLQEVFNELEAYEATNHTPEECAAAFEELAAYRAAEQDGTLLRLPCKVGDTVWILCNVFGGNEQKRVIESRTITEIKHNKFNKNTMISKEPFELHFFPSEIGKTVFLTLEAAEAALKEQEANQ